MHAIVMTEHGEPEVLSWTGAADPTPGPGEALIAVEAAGVNYIDTYHRRGLYPVDFPFTPGVEGAGTVVEVGEGVVWPAVGDRVSWSSTPGSYAELAVVAASSLVAVPDDIEAAQAAAAMVQGMTAHYLVRDTFRITVGDTCLVHAGAGGVGRLLLQMAKRLGATAYATVSTQDKAEVARAAGADHVIMYTQEDFAQACRRISGSERPFDVIYDGVGSTTFESGLGLLRPRGTMALFGQSSGPVAPVDPQVLNANGSLFLTRPSMFHYIAERKDLEARAGDVFRGITDGWLTIAFGGEWHLADAAAAHRALESRGTTGKLILRS